MDYKNMSVAEISKLPGVGDLTSFKQRGHFAMALKAEAEGDHARAKDLLAKAVDES